MEITLNKTEGKFQFEASNAIDWVNISASKELDPKSMGFRPTELLLISLAGCLSIDILNILYKQRCEITNHKVKVTGEREEVVPGIIRKIDVHLTMAGSFSEDQLKRAIKLSEETYCTVYKTLTPTAEISVSYTIA